MTIKSIKIIASSNKPLIDWIVIVFYKQLGHFEVHLK